MHILVVEDDPRLGRLLLRLLGDDRHVVELAQDAREATELLESEVALHAVILDLGLPDRSGLDVLRDLRRVGSDLPVMILTASDSIEDRVRGLDAGADDYMVKPFAYEELEARLRALARRVDRSP
jgi:DNA-binding response OmpR family regulator